jgi:hypothetical protein
MVYQKSPVKSVVKVIELIGVEMFSFICVKCKEEIIDFIPRDFTCPICKNIMTKKEVLKSLGIEYIYYKNEYQPIYTKILRKIFLTITIFSIILMICFIIIMTTLILMKKVS